MLSNGQDHLFRILVETLDARANPEIRNYRIKTLFIKQDNARIVFLDLLVITAAIEYGGNILRPWVTGTPRRDIWHSQFLPRTNNKNSRQSTLEYLEKHTNIHSISNLIENITAMEKKDNDTALQDDFLAAYHSIIFSRKSEDDRDVERRRLAVKYMTARKFQSEETAALLLSQGLRQYEALMEKADTTKGSDTIANMDRSKWRSSLKDPKVVLSLMRPLSCQTDSSDRVCGRRDPVDRDVENLTRLAEREVDEESATVRKVSCSTDGSPSYSRSSQENFPRARWDRFTDAQPTAPRSGRINTEEFSGRSERVSAPLRPEVVARSPSRRQWACDKSAGTSWADGESSRGGPQLRNRWERMDNEENQGRAEEARGEGAFRTAKAELHVQQQRAAKKTLGGKASVNSRFVCPLKRDKEREDEKSPISSRESGEPEEDERLKGIDAKLIELVRNEIMDSGAYVSWDDVAGLEHAKKIIREIVVLPMLRPDIFTGLRRPPKGILLFGPPGTGKTLIGKCIASQSKSTFFSISASSLTSKWIGEGEKMVRALFAVASVHQPSVIFIDEIDSLLTQRSETEHESSRRIKTEFLVQLDGAATGDEDRILVVGATNRPQELDEAARRRFVKRLYVPLPELDARRQIVVNLLAAISHVLTQHDIDRIAQLSEHYSGADMTNLCKEASMGPIRSIPFDMLENIRKEDVRCVTADDFDEALTHVRPSVSQSDLGLYVSWDRTYGSGTAASLATTKARD